MKSVFILAAWLLATIAYGNGYEIDFLSEVSSSKLTVKGDVDMPFTGVGVQAFHATSQGAAITYAAAAAMARNSRDGKVAAKLYNCQADMPEGSEMVFTLVEQDGETYLAARLNDDSTLVWRNPRGN